MVAQPGTEKKGATAITVFFMAQLLVAGLLWLVFYDSTDREGRIKTTLAVVKAGDVENAITSYYEEHHALPPDNNALRLPNKQGQPYFTAFEEKGNPSYTFSVANGVITLTFAQDQDPVSGKTLIFTPRISTGKLDWNCDTGSVDAKYLSPQCQGQ